MWLMCAQVHAYVAYGLCAVLGIKLAKLTPLKAMFEEKGKQNKKILRVTGLGAGAEDLLSWLKLIPALSSYTDMIEEKVAPTTKTAMV